MIVLLLDTYMGRPKNSTIPVCHKKIVTIFKTVGTCFCCLSVNASPPIDTNRYQLLGPFHPSQAPPVTGNCAELLRPWRGWCKQMYEDKEWDRERWVQVMVTKIVLKYEISRISEKSWTKQDRKFYLWSWSRLEKWRWRNWYTIGFCQVFRCCLAACLCYLQNFRSMPFLPRENRFLWWTQTVAAMSILMLILDFEHDSPNTWVRLEHSPAREQT